jgi:hypothetical protein
MRGEKIENEGKLGKGKFLKWAAYLPPLRSTG